MESLNYLSLDELVKEIKLFNRFLKSARQSPLQIKATDKRSIISELERRDNGFHLLTWLRLDDKTRSELDRDPSLWYPIFLEVDAPGLPVRADQMAEMEGGDTDAEYYRRKYLKYKDKYMRLVGGATLRP